MLQKKIDEKTEVRKKPLCPKQEKNKQSTEKQPKIIYRN